MCGIAGIVIQRAERYRNQMHAMLRAMRHRGPDGSGTMAFSNALLGHVRLSIVDLANGAQPMPAAGNRHVAVTFNGEIYGYERLRHSLASVYPFRTTGDTELLPAMYLQHGDRFVEQLPGMFAFGLWDDERRKLLLARDRFGEKPLYFAEFVDPEGVRGLVFASEMKGILASGLVKPRLNRDALAHYLQYLYVHPLQTIYENVHTLGPACLMVWQSAEGSPAIRRYWELPRERSEIGVRQAAGELRERFERAVARQLVADVPVGAFLSGGLDSSTVVAQAAKLKPGLQTFAFRFAAGSDDGSAEADETGFAAEVARMHGTTHRVLDEQVADLGAVIEEVAGVCDEPLADSSSVPMYLLSRLAREHLKVVLTGDGGDELLGGYDWYRDLLVRGGNVAENRLNVARYFSDDTLRKFALQPTALRKRIEGTGTIDDALRMDLLDYMPGDILVKIDRTAMAHGLELRAPFLDVQLAEFLISLPWRLKLDGQRDKIILREAFEACWPASVRGRGKRGFGAPVGGWLKRPDVQRLSERLHDRSHKLYTLIPFDASRLAVERGSHQAWALLMLALWLERYPA